MAFSKLRDRDAIVTKEDLIFRVLGYSHPANAYICDAEYAPARIFKSDNPKAPRSRRKHIFYKFYEDEGWRFVKENFPEYIIFHEMLRSEVLGVRYSDILQVQRPSEKLEKLMEEKPEDELLVALQDVLNLVIENSSLDRRDFGVFGSLLHGFYHPRLSDLDFVVHGSQNLHKLCETLQELYADRFSVFRNEFETDEAVKEKRWKFQNYSLQEYMWHQRRKMTYALFDCKRSGRVIKTEFEPVKDWRDIKSEYDAETKIAQKGWTRMRARVVKDGEAPYIPSIYFIEPLKVLNGPKSAIEVNRIVSYLEEFRMQAQSGETVIVEGNLEEVMNPKGNFHQVMLTYCPRYYEQMLKVVS